MKLTRTQKLTAALVILAALLAVTALIVSFAGGAPQKRPLYTGSAKLAAPDLPQLAFESYPTEEQEKELSDIAHRLESYYEKGAGYAQALTPFFESSTREILSAHKGGNQVYSPLNLYMALSMAAEITDGSTRGQILDLLGAPDIETLREQSGDIWLRSSLSYYGCELDLNNSVWLSNEIDYKQETLDILANHHFAESFRGEPGTGEYNQLLRDWTNEKTHNLLENSVQGLSMQPDMLMTLMSTVYFKGAWGGAFDEDLTQEDAFHAPNGDIRCDFMHKSSSGNYYRGEHFGAVKMYFSGSAEMLFILPDEDSGIDQLLSEDSDFWEFLGHFLSLWADESAPRWEDWSAAIINLSLPKFDVSSNNELTETLKSLGLTEMFDYHVSDFGPLMNNDLPVYISEVNHAARVMVDEEGCTAASYVEMAAAAGASAPPELKIDFTLDRPFIFLINTRDGMPLFAGVVNRP